MSMVLLSCGDAIELMKGVPDNSMDMLFTDPPYNMTHNPWDTSIDLCRFFAEAKRVIKDNGCIAIWGQAPFTYRLATSAPDIFRYEWVIEKTSAKGFLNANKMPLRAHENVLIFYKKRPLYNPQKTTGHKRKTCVRRKAVGSTNYNYGRSDYEGVYDSTVRYPRSVVKFSWDTRKLNLHSTQKPLSACEYFIKTYTDEGMYVLDPFMGSGTTGLAAKGLGRGFLGFEKDADIFNVAVRRLQGTA